MSGRFQLFLFFLCIVAHSFPVQVEQINLNATSVDHLVSVDSSLDFNSLLPGYEYAGYIDISWAVPDSALERIDENVVSVYVGFDSRRNMSGITFNYEGEKYSALNLVLTCFVEDSLCSAGSNLSKRIGITVVLDELSSSINDTLVITAHTRSSLMVDVVKKSEDTIAQAEFIRQVIDSDPEILNIIPIMLPEQVSEDFNERVQTFILYTVDEAAKGLSEPLLSNASTTLVKQNEDLPFDSEELDAPIPHKSEGVFSENLPDLSKIGLPDISNSISNSDDLLKYSVGILVVLAMLFIFLWMVLRLLFPKKRKNIPKL
ncbi:MAG: hypothetical protein ABII22_00570 [Candidatus Micrarchaeota archaeon]